MSSVKSFNIEEYVNSLGLTELNEILDLILKRKEVLQYNNKIELAIHNLQLNGKLIAVDPDIINKLSHIYNSFDLYCYIKVERGYDDYKWKIDSS